MKRKGNRRANEVRKVKIKPAFVRTAEGSCLVTLGNTKVLCTAKVEGKVPPFLRGSGHGWVTAEYGMLPGSTQTRKSRGRGLLEGRQAEIQRLIGRALRAVTALERLGERTVWIDCDVIEADGGTRVASITGAYVALVEALKAMQKKGLITEWPLTHYVGAISVGIVDGALLLDLDYEEDSRAEVDLNVVMTEK